MGTTESKVFAATAATDLIYITTLRDLLLHGASGSSSKLESRSISDSLVGALLRASDSSSRFVEALKKDSTLRREVEGALTGSEWKRLGGASWIDLLGRSGGLSGLIERQLDPLPGNLLQESVAIKDLAGQLSSGGELFTARSFGFECGLLVGVTIGLIATGGPVGMLLAVEVGGAAANSCLS